jgi:peptidoglycan/xylan/chitin deacetylase (PgdA/CDA1 family)
MRLPGRRRLQQYSRRIRGKFVKHGLILGYHRINELSWDPLHLAVSPDSFSKQLEILHDHANVISLNALATARENGGIPSRSIAITFDDGYADYLSIAQPLLEQAGFASTVFIPTGYIGGEFWWDMLSSIVSALDPAAPLTVRANGSKFDWRPGENRQAADRNLLANHLAAFLQTLQTDERRSCLQQLTESCRTSVTTSSRDRALSETEINRLAGLERVSIGSHTVSHPMLSRIPAEQQQAELTESKQTLETLIGRAVNEFAFPHGSVSEPLVRLVEKCGYGYACASHNDVVWRNSDPFQLPRIWPPDCGGDRFLKWLQRWL